MSKDLLQISTEVKDSVYTEATATSTARGALEAVGWVLISTKVKDSLSAEATATSTTKQWVCLARMG